MSKRAKVKKSLLGDDEGRGIEDWIEIVGALLEIGLKTI